jgi:hypothetical protein
MLKNEAYAKMCNLDKNLAAQVTVNNTEQLLLVDKVLNATRELNSFPGGVSSDDVFLCLSLSRLF